LSNVFDASTQLKTFCGSPIFSAPELLNGIQYTGPEVDMWSLGINLYSMVVGELPFNASTMEELLQMTASCKYMEPEFTSDGKKLNECQSCTPSQYNLVRIPRFDSQFACSRPKKAIDY
jgi:serine/threonine protein kinase